MESKMLPIALLGLGVLFYIFQEFFKFVYHYGIYIVFWLVLIIVLTVVIANLK
jgi:hypothetical protein